MGDKIRIMRIKINNNIFDKYINFFILENVHIRQTSDNEWLIDLSLNVLLIILTNAGSYDIIVDDMFSYVCNININMNDLCHILSNANIGDKIKIYFIDKIHLFYALTKNDIVYISSHFTSKYKSQCIEILMRYKYYKS